MIVALMPVRDSSWVIGYSLRAALQWCDAAVVMLHRCTDQTERIVLDVGVESRGRIVIMSDNSDPFREADAQQRMLVRGRIIGGTHFVRIDADEVLTANKVPTVCALINALPQAEVLHMPLVDLWRSLGRYRADRCVTVPLAFRDAPGLLYRPGEDDYQWHCRMPQGTTWGVDATDPRDGGLMHLQRASWRRACARQARYKMVELLTWPGRRGTPGAIDVRYNKALLEPDTMVLEDVPAEWWDHDLSLDLIHPIGGCWEAVEAERLLTQHGRDRFAGMDLYEKEWRT